MRDNLKGSVNNKTIKGQLIQTVWQPEALSDGEQLQLQTLGQCELRGWQGKALLVRSDWPNTKNTIRKIFPGQVT